MEELRPAGSNPAVETAMRSDWTRIRCLGPRSVLKACAKRLEGGWHPAAEHGLELERDRNAQVVRAVRGRNLYAEREPSRAKAHRHLGHRHAREVEDRRRHHDPGSAVGTSMTWGHRKMSWMQQHAVADRVDQLICELAAAGEQLLAGRGARGQSLGQHGEP